MFYIQKVRGQDHCFLAIIQNHSSETEREIISIFRDFSDTDLVTLILGAKVNTVPLYRFSVLPG